MTGGVQVTNGSPVADTYRINVSTAPSSLIRLSDMKQQRFGHCSVDINGTLYAFGGFCHQDGSN